MLGDKLIKPASTFFSKGIGGAYLALISITVLSKLLGFFREMLIAFKFGVSEQLDIYLLALVIPNMVYSILMYAVPNFVVPILSQKSHEENSSSSKFFSSVFFWPFLLVVAVFALCYFFFIPGIIKAMYGTHDPEALLLAIRMARTLTVFLFFSSLYCIFKGLYHSFKWFVLPALVPLFLHVFVILFLWLGADALGVESIVYGQCVGSFFMFAVLMADSFRRGKKKYFTWGFSNNTAIWKPVILVLLIEALGQTYTLIDRAFIQQLPNGFISGLNYANIMQMLPISIFGITLGAVLLPNFSDSIAKKDFKQLKLKVKKALAIMFGSGVVFGLFVYFFAPFIIRVILQRGEFSAEATDITSNFLMVLAAGIAFIMVHGVLTKLLLAGKLQGHLAITTAIAVLVKLLLSYWFIRNQWYYGLAFSTVLAFVINDILILSIVIYKNKKLIA